VQSLLQSLDKMKMLIMLMIMLMVMMIMMMICWLCSSTLQCFSIPSSVSEFYQSCGRRGAATSAKWDDLFASYQARYPKEGAELVRRIAGILPDGWMDSLPENSTPVSTLLLLSLLLLFQYYHYYCMCLHSYCIIDVDDVVRVITDQFTVCMYLYICYAMLCLYRGVK